MSGDPVCAQEHPASFLFPAFYASPPAFIVHCSEKNESSQDLRLEFNLKKLCGSKDLHPSFSQKIILQQKKKKKRTKWIHLKNFQSV